MLSLIGDFIKGLAAVQQDCQALLGFFSVAAVKVDFAQADKIFSQVFLGGTDHLETMLKGSPDDVRKQVKESIADAGEHPLMIGPGCALKLGTPVENLKALRQAVY